MAQVLTLDRVAPGTTGHTVPGHVALIVVQAVYPLVEKDVISVL